MVQGRGRTYDEMPEQNNRARGRRDRGMRKARLSQASCLCIYKSRAISLENDSPNPQSSIVLLPSLTSPHPQQPDPLKIVHKSFSTMTTGQCLCGTLKITISGEPVAVVSPRFIGPDTNGSRKRTDRIAQALCHCRDCKRISGSAFGFNWVVLVAQLSVTGTPKEYTSTANSGNPVTSHFCGNCGTTLWRDGPATQGMTYVKAGMLDGATADGVKPVAEIFTRSRLP